MYSKVNNFIIHICDLYHATFPGLLKVIFSIDSMKIDSFKLVHLIHNNLKKESLKGAVQSVLRMCDVSNVGDPTCKQTLTE